MYSAWQNLCCSVRGTAFFLLACRLLVGYAHNLRMSDDTLAVKVAPALAAEWLQADGARLDDNASNFGWQCSNVIKNKHGLFDVHGCQSCSSGYVSNDMTISAYGCGEIDTIPDKYSWFSFSASGCLGCGKACLLHFEIWPEHLRFVSPARFDRTCFAELSNGNSIMYDNTTCEVTCDAGYVLSKETVLACKDGKLTSSPPTCQPRGCGAPNVTDGFCQEGLNSTPGDGGICTTQCAPGYEPPPVGALSCTRGKWSPSTLFQCKPSDCHVQHLRNQNGKGFCIEGEKIRNGEPCHVQCQFGYWPIRRVVNCSLGALKSDQLECYPYPAIVAGTAGCVFLTLLAIMCYCWRKRRQYIMRGETPEDFGLGDREDWINILSLFQPLFALVQMGASIYAIVKLASDKHYLESGIYCLVLAVSIVCGLWYVIHFMKQCSNEVGQVFRNYAYEHITILSIIMVSAIFSTTALQAITANGPKWLPCKLARVTRAPINDRLWLRLRLLMFHSAFSENIPMLFTLAWIQDRTGDSSEVLLMATFMSHILDILYLLALGALTGMLLKNNNFSLAGTIEQAVATFGEESTESVEASVVDSIRIDHQDQS